MSRRVQHICLSCHPEAYSQYIHGKFLTKQILKLRAAKLYSCTWAKKKREPCEFSFLWSL